MKKTISIFSVLLFGGLIIGLMSCDSTTTPPNPTSQAPTLTITGVTASPVDVAPGQILNFHLEARANANTNKDLETLTVNAAFTAGGSWDTTFTPGTAEKKYYVVDLDFKVPATANDGDAITLTFKVTDKDTKEKITTWVLNVKVFIDIYTYTNITLGAQNNATLGSFYASSTNTVYLITDAKTNCTKVDFGYYYGATNAATLCAPSDAIAAAQIFNGPTYGLSTWPVRNATKFRKIALLTTTEFDALDAGIMLTKYTTAPGAEGAYANTLSDGSGGMQQSFVAFKTANPVKYGIIKVDEIDIVNQATGQMKITVKIQK